MTRQTTTMTRRTVLGALAVLPLVGIPAPVDDEPVWDFEISDGLCKPGEVFVWALARGSVQFEDREDWGYDQADWGAYFFDWQKTSRLLAIGARALCEDMLVDQMGEGEVGKITVYVEAREGVR